MEAFHKAADLEPNNPQGYHLVATYYQEKAAKDFRLTAAQKKEYIAKGIEAENKALALNRDYVEALVYKNILLRSRRTSRRTGPSSRRSSRKPTSSATRRWRCRRLAASRPASKPTGGPALREAVRRGQDVQPLPCDGPDDAQQAGQEVPRGTNEGERRPDPGGTGRRGARASGGLER